MTTVAPPSSPEPISDQLAFLITARAYREGAFAILTNERVRGEHQTDRRFVLPAVMLIGHAIEVYLKAWVGSHGVDNDELRKSYGHDIAKLFAKAKALGIVEPPRPVDQTFQDLIEAFAPQHGNYSFRYPGSDWTFNVPQMDIVFQILDDLDVAVANAFANEPTESMSISAEQNLRLPSE